LGWKGPLEVIWSNPPTITRDIFNLVRLLRVPFNLTLLKRETKEEQHRAVGAYIDAGELCGPWG